VLKEGLTPSPNDLGTNISIRASSFHGTTLLPLRYSEIALKYSTKNYVEYRQVEILNNFSSLLSGYLKASPMLGL
jgi:ABC-type anion transport system duplicated permease subunit